MNNMNSVNHQTQHNDEIILDAAQSNINDPEKEAVSYHASDTPWLNIQYGLVMIAIMAIPPLIPGVTIQLLIMGYMFVIVLIYTMAAILTAMRVLRPTKISKRSKNKMQYR